MRQLSRRPSTRSSRSLPGAPAIRPPQEADRDPTETSRCSRHSGRTASPPRIRIEPLRNPRAQSVAMVANGQSRQPHRTGETVATVCDPLPRPQEGEEGSMRFYIVLKEYRRRLRVRIPALSLETRLRGPLVAQTSVGRLAQPCGRQPPLMRKVSAKTRSEAVVVRRRSTRTRPVTPEVAGSSPVAPVIASCKSAPFVISLGATTAGFSPASRADSARQIGREPDAKTAANSHVLPPVFALGESPVPSAIPRRSRARVTVLGSIRFVMARFARAAELSSARPLFRPDEDGPLVMGLQNQWGQRLNTAFPTVSPTSSPKCRRCR